MSLCDFCEHKEKCASSYQEIQTQPQLTPLTQFCEDYMYVGLEVKNFYSKLNVLEGDM